MTIHYRDSDVTVYHGDCLANPSLRKRGVADEILKRLPDNSVDAVVTDPPYGIRFMGKSWDGADIEERTARGRETSPMPDGVGGPRGGYRSAAAEAGRYDLSANAAFGEWCREWAVECMRILKPGGYLLSFGGSRTWHRLAAGIEDAGFEMRDSIAWLYGSGFPKSLDVAKAIDKAASYEGAVIGTEVVDAGMQGGHMHAGRDRKLVTREVRSLSSAAEPWRGWGTALKPSFEPIVVARKPLAGTVAQNVLEYGTGALNVDGCRVGDELRVNPPGSTNPRVAMGDGWREDAEPTTVEGRWPTNVVLDEHQAAALDQQSGTLKSGTMRAGTERQPRAGGTIYGADARTFTPADTYGDSGGASRFFPVFRYEAKAPGSERPSVDGAAHPTVKPLDLMRWLIRLVTPPNGLVLDPFAGSGTTAEACIHEHMRCITIEREAEYLPLITARLSKPMAIGFDFAVDTG